MGFSAKRGRRETKLRKATIIIGHIYEGLEIKDIILPRQVYAANRYELEVAMEIVKQGFEDIYWEDENIEYVE